MTREAFRELMMTESERDVLLEMIDAVTDNASEVLLWIKVRW
jgi:hypothetical protein